MAFKEVASLDSDTTTALGGFNRKTNKKNPTSAEGYYLGSKKVDSPRAKSGFAYLHILQTPKGNLGVWGKTDMDRKMLSATPGTMVRITHTGMQATPNGEMYKFKVEVDPDNSIDVSGLANSGQSSTEDDSYSASSSSFSSDEESDEAEGTEDQQEDEEQDDTAAITAARAAQERRAKVQALLGKGKKAN